MNRTLQLFVPIGIIVICVYLIIQRSFDAFDWRQVAVPLVIIAVALVQVVRFVIGSRRVDRDGKRARDGEAREWHDFFPADDPEPSTPNAPQADPPH